MAGATLISRHKMDDSDFQRKARKAGDTAREMSEKMRAQFVGAAKSFAGIFAVGSTVGVIKNMMTELDRVGKISARLGMSADAIQRMGFIASQNGADMELFARALTMASRELSDPKNKSAADAARALGINVKEFLKLDAVRQMGMLSDAYKGVADKGLAASLIFDLMGKASVEMIPTLETGSAAIIELGNSVDTVSDKSVAKIEMINDAWDKFAANTKTRLMESTLAVADFYGNIGDFLPKMVEAIEAATGKTGTDHRLDMMSIEAANKRKRKQAILDGIAERNRPKTSDADMDKISASQMPKDWRKWDGNKFSPMPDFVKKDLEDVKKKHQESLVILEKQRETWKGINAERMRGIRDASKVENAAAAGFDPQSGLSGLGEANLLKMRGGRRGKGGFGLDYLKGFGMSDGTAFPGLAGLAGLGKQNNDPNQFRKAETEMIRIAKDQFELMKEALAAG